MNQIDQALVSAYLDGELSPSEASAARALLESDPDARQVYNDYLQISQSIAELPRTNAPADFVTRIQPVIKEIQQRPTWLSWFDELPVGISWVSTAIVSVVTLLIGGYFVASTFQKKTSIEIAGPTGPALNNDNRNTTTQAEKIPKVTLDKASDSTVITSSQPTHLAETKTAVRKPEQVHSLSFPIDQTLKASTSKLFPGIDDYLNKARNVDQRHALRVHVDTANVHVESIVTGILGRFHQSGTSVIRVLDRKFDREYPSIRFFALVPTSQSRQLIAALTNTFENNVDQDKPGNASEVLNLPKEQLELIDDQSLKRAIDSVHDIVTTAKSSLSPETVLPSDTTVEDAISKRLEPGEFGSSYSGTLDEFMIVIRSDNSLENKTKASSTKPSRKSERSSKPK